MSWATAAHVVSGNFTGPGRLPEPQFELGYGDVVLRHAQEWPHAPRTSPAVRNGTKSLISPSSLPDQDGTSMSAEASRTCGRSSTSSIRNLNWRLECAGRFGVDDLQCGNYHGQSQGKKHGKLDRTWCDGDFPSWRCAPARLDRTRPRPSIPAAPSQGLRATQCDERGLGYRWAVSLLSRRIGRMAHALPMLARLGWRTQNTRTGISDKGSVA